MSLGAQLSWFGLFANIGCAAWSLYTAQYYLLPINVAGIIFSIVGISLNRRY